MCFWLRNYPGLLGNKEGYKNSTQFNFVQPIKMLTSKLTKKEILKKKMEDWENLQI